MRRMQNVSAMKRGHKTRVAEGPHWGSSGALLKQRQDLAVSWINKKALGAMLCSLRGQFRAKAVTAEALDALTN